MTDDSAIIEMIPFPPPSPAMLDMLQWLAESQLDFYTVTAIEFQHQELLGLTELTGAQVDRLLTRGSL